MTANPFNKLNPGSAGPPPFVIALLVVTVIALTLALLNPTVQELGRRQPKLSVLAEQANDDDVVTVSALRPWPVDIDRVVANEVAAARQTLSTRSTVMNTMVRLHDPFAVLPSDIDRDEARGAFEQELTDYEVNLRSWLTDYATAASVCSQTVALTLRLTNDRGGAHADAVTVVLDLPPTITTAEDWPSMALPPKRPCYEPPRPRSLPADQSGWSRTPLITSVRRRTSRCRNQRPGAGWVCPRRPLIAFSGLYGLLGRARRDGAAREAVGTNRSRTASLSAQAGGGRLAAIASRPGCCRDHRPPPGRGDGSH